MKHKGIRRKQFYDKWKKRVKNFLPYSYLGQIHLESGEVVNNPTWVDAMKSRQFDHLQKNSGACSCAMCQLEKKTNTKKRRNNKNIQQEIENGIEEYETRYDEFIEFDKRYNDEGFYIE